MLHEALDRIVAVVDAVQYQPDRVDAAGKLGDKVLQSWDSVVGLADQCFDNGRWGGCL